MAAFAAIGPRGELSLYRQNGEASAVERLADPEAATGPRDPAQPVAFAWPTWTADAAAVLVSTLPAPAQSVAPAAVLRYTLGQARPTVLYRNAEATGLLGPSMPHYLNPSPDARHVALLTPTPLAGLTLLFADAEGRGPAQTVARGSPLFSAWSPQSDALLLHVGGELSLLELASAPATAVFALNHAGYRVPAWAPDGRSFAISAKDGARPALQLLDRDGKRIAALAPSGDTATFSWSPDGSRLALAQLQRRDSIRYADLHIVPANGDSSRKAACAVCVGFVWSPTGEYLAVLEPAAREGTVHWLVLDREGELVCRFPPFAPSPEFGIYLAFFDQYALSHRLWSPDGSLLLAFGRMQLNGTPPELLASSIYVHSVPAGDVRAIAPGSVAFWSPRD